MSDENSGSSSRHHPLTMAGQAGGVTDRCADSDSEAGRCQLEASHSGLHAAADDHAYLTWQYGDLVRWPKSAAATWLAELPWVVAMRR